MDIRRRPTSVVLSAEPSIGSLCGPSVAVFCVRVRGAPERHFAGSPDRVQAWDIGLLVGYKQFGHHQERELASQDTVKEGPGLIDQPLTSVLKRHFLVFDRPRDVA